MSMLIINRINATITVGTKSISPYSSAIIPENTYQFLLQTSESFRKYINNKFIVCSPIADKINSNTKQTITNNNNTTNNDSVIHNNTTTQKNSQIDTDNSTTEISKLINDKVVSVPNNSNVKKNKRGRKTRLVETDENNVNEE